MTPSTEMLEQPTETTSFDRFVGKRWAPMIYTKAVSSRTRGDEIIDFMETFMTVPTATPAAKAGSPIRLTEWQKELLRCMFEEDENGVLRYSTFLWSVARKNAKSLLLTGIGLYFLAFGGPGQQVIAAAASIEQANIIFGVAKKQVQRSPYLSKIIKPYKNQLVNRYNDSTFKTVPADADRVQGLGGSVILFDEIHSVDRPTNLRGAQAFWQALSSSRNNREESIMIGITTAGHNLHGSMLGGFFKRLVEESQLEPSYNNRFGGAWWGIPDDMNPLDENNWYMANPNLEENMINISTLREEYKASENDGTVGLFMRMALNLWVKAEGESFVSSVQWNRAEKVGGDIPRGSRVTAGFDGSIGSTGNSDSTAIVIQDYDTGIFKIWDIWEHDGSDVWHVSGDDVEASIKKLFETFDVVDIFFDGSNWDVMLNKWAEMWPDRITRIPQTRSRITPMANNFVRELYEGQIFHTGEEKLSEHVMNAVRTEDGGYAKQKAKGIKIDALVAAVLANAARDEHKIEDMQKVEYEDFIVTQWN